MEDNINVLELAHQFYDSLTRMEILDQKFKETIEELRIEKLKNGYPFMIFDKKLEKGFFMEFPDGEIAQCYFLYEKDADGKYQLIKERVLTEEENYEFRVSHGLPPRNS